VKSSRKGRGASLRGEKKFNLIFVEGRPPFRPILKDVKESEFTGFSAIEGRGGKEGGK